MEKKRNENCVLLVVEDDRHVLDTVVSLLSSRFDEVLIAENGRRALDVIESGVEISCILSDIKMPEMDGIELIISVRNKGLRTPFIFFTAYDNKEYMLQALRYGAYDFIEKPNFDNLVSTVQHAVTDEIEEISSETIRNHVKKICK